MRKTDTWVSGAARHGSAPSSDDLARPPARAGFASALGLLRLWNPGRLPLLPRTARAGRPRAPRRVLAGDAPEGVVDGRLHGLGRLVRVASQGRRLALIGEALPGARGVGAAPAPPAASRRNSFHASAPSSGATGIRLIAISQTLVAVNAPASCATNPASGGPASASAARERERDRLREHAAPRDARAVDRRRLPRPAADAAERVDVDRHDPMAVASHQHGVPELVRSAPAERTPARTRGRSAPARTAARRAATSSARAPAPPATARASDIRPARRRQSFASRRSMRLSGMNQIIATST